MPNIASARKRVRQTKTRTERNRAMKSRMKTFRKNVIAAVEAGKLDEAQTHLSAFSSAADKCAKKNVIHKNTASRYKSNLSKLIAKASA